MQVDIEMRDGSLGWKGPLGGGHGNSLQYSCQENPLDREAWQAAVYRTAQGLT